MWRKKDGILVDVEIYLKKERLSTLHIEGERVCLNRVGIPKSVESRAEAVR
jgi:hypothetical protein